MELFNILVSATATLTSAACMVLLFRGYLRRRVRLLMWSALCFTGLTLNNIALFCDLVLFPEVNLQTIRLAAALCGMLILLYGFIWDAD